MDHKGKQGTWYWFSPGGDLQGSTQYKDGVKEGIERMYHRGAVSEETVWKNGVEEEIIDSFCSYLRHTKRKGRRSWYKKVYSSEGLLLSECWLKDPEGRPHGSCKIYDATGALREVCRYKNGIRDGICTLLYATGEPMARINFKKGLPHGWAYYWDKNGTCLEKKVNEHGVVSEVVTWDGDKGERKAVTNFARRWLREKRRTL
jgi:antitoxin component YwqK of YwqJK toxin-antitoxin module